MKISKMFPGWYAGPCGGCGEEMMAAKRTPRCDDCWPAYSDKVVREHAERRLERARDELAKAEACLKSLPAPLSIGRME